MKYVITILILISLFFVLMADFKNDALAAFKKQDAQKALELLEKARQKNPNDGEIYYYLGRILHFRLYDIGERFYYEIKSDSVISYLDKAIELDSTIGNAYYYLGVEYGLRAHYALFDNDTIKAIKELSLGFEKGGFPAWLLEYAENSLISCDSNAILFTGGDAEANSLWYLQLVQRKRRDVSVIPLGLLSYKPFIKFSKIGIENFFSSIPISITTDSLDKITYKLWTPDTLYLTVPDYMLKHYSILTNDYIMQWTLEPDMVYDGKKIIFPGTLILIDLLKTNNWKRPVYFTLGSQPNMRASLTDYLQYYGFVMHLVPINVNIYEIEMDYIETERIVNSKDRFKYYYTVKNHNMPRCSMILNNYFMLYSILMDFYEMTGQDKKAKLIENNMMKFFPDSIRPIPEFVKKTLSK